MLVCFLESDAKTPAQFKAHFPISVRNGHFLCKVAVSEDAVAEMGLNLANSSRFNVGSAAG